MTKKYALCVSHPDEISKLAKGEVETIEARMVDREICEKPEHELHQLIPYLTFYSVLPEEGKLEILQYERAKETTEGDAVSEERLAGMTSVGFGGHIDLEEDISYSSKSTVTTDYKGTEEGETIQEEEVVYVLTMDQLVETTQRVLEREVTEELGTNFLKEMDIGVTPSEMMIFKGKEANEVNRVHLALSCVVKVTPEQLTTIKENSKVAEDEITQVAIMGINFGNLIASFNLKVAVDSIVGKLRSEHSLEDWSQSVVSTLIYGLANIVIMTIDYPTLYAVHLARVKAFKEAQEKAQNEAVETEETSDVQEAQEEE